MFNLKYASQSIRKAAALFGIKSGKYEPVFTPDNSRDRFGHAVIARVFNKRFPDSVEITDAEAEHALNYSWREILKKQ